MHRLTTSPRANESIFEALNCPEPPFSTLKHFGTWVLVWLQDVYGRFGVWVLVLLQGAGCGLEPAGWCPCRAPQGMPLSTMLMGLWSRKQKFRSRFPKAVWHRFTRALALRRHTFKGMIHVGSHCGRVGIA